MSSNCVIPVFVLIGQGVDSAGKHFYQMLRQMLIKEQPWEEAATTIPGQNHGSVAGVKMDRDHVGGNAVVEGFSAANGNLTKSSIIN
jgi:hypothetical protein